MMQRLIILTLGAIFGTTLVKSEVVSWFRIQQMFRFEEPYMYLVIGSAIAVGMVSVALIKYFRPKTITGEEIIISENLTIKASYSVASCLVWAGQSQARARARFTLKSGQVLILLSSRSSLQSVAYSSMD